MVFSSPQQSRLASRHSSDFWEPNPRQRSHSLNPTVLRTKFAISDSEDEGESAAQKAKVCVAAKALPEEKRSNASCQHGQKRVQRAFVPDFLNPPACLSSLPHQRRKNLRQCSLSVLDTPSKQNPNTDSKPQSPSSLRSHSTRSSPSRANTVDRFLTISNHNTSPMVRDNQVQLALSVMVLLFSNSITLKFWHLCKI